MCLALHDEARRELVRAGHVEDVRLPFRRLALRRVFERERIAGKGGCKDPKGQSHEVLFDSCNPWLGWGQRRTASAPR